MVNDAHERGAGGSRARPTPGDQHLTSSAPVDATKAGHARGANGSHMERATDVTEERECEIRPSDDPIRVLLLCDYQPYNAATICDHINSFYRFSRHEIVVFSNVGDLPDWFSFEPFDVVVVHYSVFIAVDAYVPPRTRHLLATFRGLKILFIQDEYRFVERTRHQIVACGIKVVFTCVADREIPKVYPPDLLPDTQFVNVLTGYVPEGLKLFRPKPLADRRRKVGYRGRVYPAWHGEAGREKHEIGTIFREQARQHGISVDIAVDERSRIYGLQWIDFIRDSWAVLAVESGASVFDFDGTIAARTESFVSVLGLDARSSRRVRRMLRKYGALSKDPMGREVYQELRRRFFEDRENQIDLAQISPRVLEAATLQTLLIMYEGEYSGLLQPWRHYVPLKKDFSNFTEIVSVLNDPPRVADIIACCYAEVSENPDHSYSRFIDQFDRVVTEELAGATRSKVVQFDRKYYNEKKPFYYVSNPHALPPAARSNLVSRARSVLRTPARALRRIVGQ